MNSPKIDIMKHCQRICYSPEYHDETNYHALDEVFSDETIEQSGRLVKVSTITKVDRCKEKDGLKVSDFSIDSLLATGMKKPDKIVTMPYPSKSNVAEFNNYVDMLEELGINQNNENNADPQVTEENKTE